MMTLDELEEHVDSSNPPRSGADATELACIETGIRHAGEVEGMPFGMLHGLAGVVEEAEACWDALPYWLNPACIWCGEPSLGPDATVSCAPALLLHDKVERNLGIVCAGCATDGMGIQALAGALVSERSELAAGRTG